MQFKLFTFNTSQEEEIIEKMNKFINFNKVVDIEKHFFILNNSAYWSFCIQYINTQNPTQSVFDKKVKIDYKNILNENQFQKFLKLRTIRKNIAENDAIPAYAVFTDAELAEIAIIDELTEINIKKINGIGEKKAEKYGKIICELIQNNL